MYQPKYRITPYLLNCVDKASSLRAWIDLAPLKVSWLPAMQQEARTKSAHFSTSIEGNPLTLSQVRSLEQGKTSGAAFKHELEVKNYLKAIKFIEESAEEIDFDEKHIFKLHRMITKGLLEESKQGTYKQKQNYVVDENKIKVFTPPPPAKTQPMIQELLNWLGQKETRELHCIVVAAIFHHHFVSIHPFSDGNGRLARLLSSLILFKREYDSNHIFSIDEIFANNRKYYYLKLQQVRELDMDLTPWIEYYAEAVVKTMKNVKKRIEDLQISPDQPIYLTHSQEELLRILRDNPCLRVADLIQQMKVTRSRINQIISPLIEKGIIEKQGQSRATTYHLALN